MENTESRLYFASDYMEGAHPAIMKKLMETNLEKTVGYGQDPYTEDAKEKIREACNAPEADVFLLVGGTQTNATVIDALLKSYQGVVAADTGHIATHESGAIEFGGHKVLTVPQKDGKISAQQSEKLVKAFYDDFQANRIRYPVFQRRISSSQQSLPGKSSTSLCGWCPPCLCTGKPGE